MKRVTLLLGCVAVCLVICALAVSTPAAVAQDPTLDAAIGIIIAATRAEQDRRNAIAATRAAIDADAARQRANAQATVAALSIEQTRSAMEATRNYQAIRTALDVQSTRTALDLTAAAERQRQDATATRQAISLDATRQAATATAVMGEFQAEGTRQAIRRQAEAESRRESLQVAGIITLFGISIILAGLAARGLWRIAPRQPIVIMEGTLEADAQPEPARMPDTVQIVNNPAMVDVLDKWAEKYDAERGSGDGN